MNHLFYDLTLSHARSGPSQPSSPAQNLRARLHTLMVHPLFEVAVRALFQDRCDIEFGLSLSRWEDLAEAFAKPGDDLMDVLITDIALDARLGPRCFDELRELRPQLAVIHLLPETEDASVIVQAFRLGANAYLFQTTSTDLLERAVNTVLEGRSYIQNHLIPLVLAEIRRPEQAVYSVEVDVHVTDREQMLLQLATDGLNNRAIAEVFGVTEKTVRGMWSTLIRKLGVHDRTQAVLWAIRSGFTRLH
ncbi:MAG: response regulator transcription factor [Alicyclobacillus herbarius]|uniref:LuxR C-terminal-related transcriptional regulator n=1 Tax=Alicyclobacillus herbarius TaxID=122960 RepID=UPI0023566D2A|nr:response regulator transcription factor [Alicyclobacillus herbarius]MCL6633863.1 response regulator transcription factor [Alicyclobacillus herbarius]